MGEERSLKLSQTVHEGRNQILRDKRPGGVERTIRQKAAKESRRTTDRLAGRVGTGNTSDRSWPIQTEGNQAGTRDPATSIRTRDAADLKERRLDASLGLHPKRRRAMENRRMARADHDRERQAKGGKASRPPGEFGDYYPKLVRRKRTRNSRTNDETEGQPGR